MCLGRTKNIMCVHWDLQFPSWDTCTRILHPRTPDGSQIGVDVNNNLESPRINPVQMT